MKVGDVVTDVDGWLGIVVRRFDNHTMRRNMVLVMWSDGLVEHCDVGFLKVISACG